MTYPASYMNEAIERFGERAAPEKQEPEPEPSEVQIAVGNTRGFVLVKFSGKTDRLILRPEMAEELGRQIRKKAKKARQ